MGCAWSFPPGPCRFEDPTAGGVVFGTKTSSQIAVLLPVALCLWRCQRNAVLGSHERLRVVEIAETAGVAQHVGMSLDLQARALCGGRNDARKASGGEWTAAL